jgi:branched-chain amino acid transport system substrate-binding protein
MPSLKKILNNGMWCLFIVAVSLCGCAPKSPVLLGFTAELTGKQSSLAVHLRNGVEMAVEELNASGGIDGRQIKLLVEDDLGTPEGARAAENKLIDAGVVAVIGHFTSAQTLAGYAVNEARGVLLFSATASTSALTAKKDLFFRTVASTESLGQGFGRYVCGDLGIRSIGIIYDLDNGSYSTPLMESFKSSFTGLDCQVTSQVEFSEAASPDFSPLVDELKESNPEAVLIIASPANTAVIAQLVDLKNWEVELFTSSWAQSEITIQNGGKTVEGLEMIIAFDVNNPSPALQEFKTNYQKHYNASPVFTAMEGYETMRMLAAALQKTGGESVELPGALLELKDFQGLVGTVRMDQYGDAIRPLFILNIHQGSFETVRTLDSPQ